MHKDVSEVNEQSSPDAGGLVVAVGQFTSVADVASNLAKIEELTREAAGSNAGLIVFPEAAMYDWQASADEIAAAAQSHGQYFEEELSRIAAANKITIVAGAFVRGPAEKPLNRLIAVGPHGATIGGYDKLHLYDAFSFRESDKVQRGDVHADMSELCIIPVGPFQVGLLNCYDLRFPEMARALVNAGANVLVVSSAWVAGPYKEMHWELLLRARAIENTCYVLGSSQPPPASVGLTMVIDPFGLVAGTCAETEGIVVTRISQNRLDEVRAIVPSLEHQRYAIVPAPRTT